MVVTALKTNIKNTMPPYSADLSQTVKYLESNGVEIDIFTRNEPFTLDTAVLALCEFCRYARDASVDAIWVPLEDYCYDDYRDKLPNGLSFAKAVPVTRIITLAVKLSRKLNAGIGIMRELLPLAVNANSSGAKRPSLIGSKAGCNSTGPACTGQDRRSGNSASMPNFERRIIAAFEAAVEYRHLVNEFRQRLSHEIKEVESVCSSTEELGMEVRVLTDDHALLQKEYQENDVVKSLKENTATLDQGNKEFQTLQARNKSVDDKLRRNAETVMTLRKNIAAQQEKIDKSEEKIQKFTDILSGFPDDLEETYKTLEQDRNGVYLQTNKAATEALEQVSTLSTTVKSISHEMELLHSVWQEITACEQSRLELLGKRKGVESEVKSMKGVYSQQKKILESQEEELKSDLAQLENEKEKVIEEMNRIDEREKLLASKQLQLHEQTNQLEQQINGIQQKELDDVKRERIMMQRFDRTEEELDTMLAGLHQREETFMTEKERTEPWMEQQLREMAIRIKEALDDKSLPPTSANSSRGGAPCEVA